MIRDFWKVKDKPNLKQEIDAIQDKVDPGLWKAIDGIREMGNIGAHMEKDVNLIIDIEPDEAEQLIKLIELLFKEWYVAKHDEVGFDDSVDVVNDHLFADRPKGHEVHLQFLLAAMSNEGGGHRSQFPFARWIKVKRQKDFVAFLE